MCNDLAWLLVTCPHPRLRDQVQALGLARTAVDRSPSIGTFRRTLGVAHYRAGDWNAAITALDKSMQLRAGGDASDRFFLAIAHWRKGDKEQATKWYDEAIDWMEKNKSQDQELRRFRSEAEDLLGIADARMPNGVDAFRKD